MDMGTNLAMNRDGNMNSITLVLYTKDPKRLALPGLSSYVFVTWEVVAVSTKANVKLANTRRYGALLLQSQ